MEVDPELFAWLTSLGILQSPFKQPFHLSMKTVELFLRGKYMTTILSYLQEAYNNFYNLNFNYVNILSQMKQIDENIIGIEIKYYNWNIILKVLKNFGLNYTKDQISDLVSGNTVILSDILWKIYHLCTEFIKRTEGFETSKQRRRNLPSPEISNQNKYQKILDSEYINIDTLSKNKDYHTCVSPLEFIVVSLCKNFNLSARQAVALLSNNRKYLSILCNRGLKGDFTNIKQWLTDLKLNHKSMLFLINEFKDGKCIYYSTIGCGLYSKNENVIKATADLLGFINHEKGCDLNWLVSEGIDMFIYSITKNDNLSQRLSNLLFELSDKNYAQLIDAIVKRSENKDNKNQIFDLFSSLVTVLQSLNNDLLNKQFANVILSTCSHNTDDLPQIISLLSDTWFYINDSIDNDFIDYFIHLLEVTIKDRKCLATVNVAISHMFILIERLSKIKSRYAPQLYKKSVMILTDIAYNRLVREIFLNNYTDFFMRNQMVPIEIMLSPYLDKLIELKESELCDLLFFNKMLTHPRMEYDFLHKIITISLNYGKLEPMKTHIINLINDEYILDKICEVEEKKEIYLKYVNYINKTIQLYLNKLYNENNRMVLNTAEKIISLKIKAVNDELFNTILNAVKQYRKEQQKHSPQLLKLLWYYNDYDTLLLQIEEENRDNYILPKEFSINDMVNEDEAINHTNNNNDDNINNEVPEKNTNENVNNNEPVKNDLSANNSFISNKNRNNKDLSKPLSSKKSIQKNEDILDKSISSIHTPLKKHSHNSSLVHTENDEYISNSTKPNAHGIRKGYINSASVIRNATRKDLKKSSSSSSTAAQINQKRPPLPGSATTHRDIKYRYHNVYPKNVSLDKKKQMEMYNDQINQINKLKEENQNTK